MRIEETQNTEEEQLKRSQETWKTRRSKKNLCYVKKR